MAAKDIAGFTGRPGRAHVLRSGRAEAMGADTRAAAAVVEKVREARMTADLNMVDGVRVCGGFADFRWGLEGEAEGCSDDYFSR